MKVNHNDDLDTHAVIGGKNVLEFKIAQTAEFFTVLSSTLYSNKPLAVIREVLCNAWDSHINSNITDKPVIVTITDDELIIRDFGKGIAPDDMQDIYCVYGNSTKTNDGNQTGGFGLGSKAPFAYSDHFTVTTFYKNIKTLYAISRGSKLTQGKPDLRIMVQVPTTESGLQVTIPIRDKKDKETFIEITESIASLGEMNVLLNNSKIIVLPISEAKNNFLITKTDLPQNSSIYVKYGNVVYPVNKHDNYHDSYLNIISNLSKIPDGYYNNSSNLWKIIIQAPPNSIAVTPSRESLSMTETTINTLTELFQKVNINFNLESNEFNNYLYKNIKIIIDDHWLKGKPNKLLFHKSSRIDHNYKIPNHLFNYADIAKLYIAKSTLLSSVYKFKEIQDSLQSLIDNNYTRKYDIINLKKILKKEYNLKKQYIVDHNSDFKIKILRPIVKSILKNPKLNLKNMFVTALKEYGDKSPYGFKFIPIIKADPIDQTRNNLLQGVVYITYGKLAFADNFDLKKYSSIEGNYVYIVSRNKEHKKNAIDHFTKLGFNVIDQTVYIDSLPKDISYISPPSKPKVEGVISLNSLLNKYDSFIKNGHRDEDKNHIRLDNPEFIFKPYNLSGSGWDKRFFQFNDNTGFEIVKLFGSRGGIVVNEKQYDKYIINGSKNGYLFLFDELIREFSNNSRIRDYFIFKKITDKLTNASIRNMVEKLNNFLLISNYSSILKKKYNLPTSITTTDRYYINIYENMCGYYAGDRFTEYGEKTKSLISIIDSFSITPSHQYIIDIFLKNKDLINLLNWEKILNTLKVSTSMKERVRIEILIINLLSN